MRYLPSYPHFVVVVISLFSLGLLGCSTEKKETASPSQAPRIPLTVQLSWFHEYSSSPFYLAESNQYFAQNGLDVTLLEGGFDAEGNFINPLPKLLAGEADFITMDLPGLLQARAAGEPLVAIAAITQRSPLTLMSLPASDINQPQDLVGKRVAINDSGSRMLLETLLKEEGIAAAEVEIINRTEFGVEPLLNGEVDVMGGWIVNEGQMLVAAGQQPNYILFTDYGINTYDFLIVTTEDTVANRPEDIQKFMDAFLQGLQAMIDDPDKAAAVTLEYKDSLQLADQLSRLKVYIPLVNPPGVTLGLIDPAVMAFSHDLLLANGVLTVPLDLEAAYTTRFVGGGQ